MAALLQDIGYAIRQLRKSPGFFAAAVATLAIGIGATTAIFSIVDAALLRPLPFPHAESLIDVRTAMTNGHVTTGLMSMAEITALNDMHLPGVRAGGFSSQPYDATIAEDAGTLVHVVLTAVTENLLPILGLPLARGGGFHPEDFLPARSDPPQRLVISYRLWRDQFGSDPSIVGRSVRFAETPGGGTIVGVAAPAFDLPHGTDIWYAARQSPQDISHWLDGVVRVPEGARLEPIRSAAAAAMTGLARTIPADVDRVYVMQPLLSSIVGDLATTLVIVLAATALLLLLGCVNVTSLVLSRGSVRLRELAIRAALGAGRPRLIRQLMTESAVLAGAGTLVGLALAYAIVHLMLGLGAAALPRLDQVPFDWRVGLFAVGVLAAASVLMGLLPAWRLARADVRMLLNEGGRSATMGRGMARLMSSMIVIEIALAIVLAAGAGWLVQSYARLSAIDPGFVPAGRLVLDVRPMQRFPGVDQARAWSAALLDRVRATAGVAWAGAGATYPLGPERDTSTGVAFDGEPTNPIPHSTHVRAVSPGYFRTAGIRLLAGRDFTDDDRVDTDLVAIVNEAFVRGLIAPRNPLTTQFRFGYPDIQSKPHRIVGVVNDVLYTSLSDRPEPTFYLVASQPPYALWRQSIVVTAERGDPAALVTGIRSQLHAFDPMVDVSFESAPAIVSSTLERPRLGMTLMLLFGATALVLAAVGIFGVIAYTSAQREEEIATRIALGATRRQVFWLLVRGGQRLAVAGIAIGLVAAFAGGRIAAGSVYAMRAADPLVLGLAAIVVAGITFVATTIPAVRASRLDPVRALRSE